MSAPSLSEAMALMNQGAFTAARAICQQHLAHTPDDFNARHLLGLVQFKAGNLLAATKELSRASKQVQPPRFKAQALNNLALVLQARGKLEQALTACRDSLRLQPEEAAFQLNYLGLLEQLQQWQSILDYVQHAPPLAEVAEAQLTLAVAQRHLHQHEQALSTLAPLPKSIEVESERALNLCLLDRTHLILQQDPPAEAALLIRLADYCAEEGHPAAATPLYRAAAEAEPDNLSVRHMISAAEGQCTAAAPNSYVRDLYDIHATEFESRLRGRLGYDAPERLCGALREYLDTSAPLEAVDLGCGTGLCGVELRKQLPIKLLSGCDLSAQMLRQAECKKAYDQLSCCSMEEYLHAMKPARLITATDVLIYTGSLAPLMPLIWNALLPGGLFAFTVEQGRDEEDVSLHPSGRYRHSRKHIRTQAEALGFEVCALDTFDLRLEHDSPVNGLMVILQRPA
ncbi:methyltransferase domain-containing protein [Marinobacterium weihaiense]|uniref:Methyltransferase domain-containing protein n=1 Tax=Marinobacterium weihaiense TaxID=2851016 RepID=A0ABS6M972_9GAMM|nr:methyltransferase domain-containing protein [Marinobacterium weihaiense]MBV0932823.1 hypothetical protein [Marinobacterium weihaiense]